MARRSGKTVKKAKGKNKPKRGKAARKAIRIKPAAKRAARKTSIKKAAVIEQLLVEKAKFSHPQPQPVKSSPSEELPGHYGVDRIVLQVRDPWWLYAWWEAGSKVMERIKIRNGCDLTNARRVLRVYDVTDTDFSGNNAVSFFDIGITDFAESWYIKAGPGRSWCVDLGLVFGDVRFITILRSNVVSTPPDVPSAVTDEEWLVPEELFMRLYGMGLGSGRASPSKGWQARVGWASMSSPGKKQENGRKGSKAKVR